MELFNLNSDEKMFSARIEDLIRKADEKNVPCFTDFLTGRECEIVKTAALKFGAAGRVVLFGGFDDAERRMAGFFPDYYFYADIKPEELYPEFPVKLLRIECSGFREHTHRDFLGSLLSLGVERCVIGDIIVAEKGFSADVFVIDRIAGYIAEELRLVGHDGVKVSVLEYSEAMTQNLRFEEISCTCASLRIDGVLSEVIGISRDKAEKALLSENVCLNYRSVTEKSREVKTDDVISVRGFGKFRISAIGDTNRRGRIRFTVQKYI